MLTVKSVEIESINPSEFPRVRVRARALDAQGSPVAGIPAAAISVVEANTRRPLLVLENAVQPPRVLFVLDTSDSLPAGFRGAQVAAIARSMATGLLAIDPRCQFSVGAVMGGLADVTPWLTDPATLETAVTQASGYASDLWKAMEDASRLDATVIVLITDGESDNPPSALQLTRMAAGPPAILLKVGDATDNSLALMAQITGGERFEVSQASEATNAVASFIKRLTKAPLLIEYQAPIDGPSKRRTHGPACAGWSGPDPGRRHPTGVAGSGWPNLPLQEFGGARRRCRRNTLRALWPVCHLV
jgi:hypothetical protein